LTIRGRKEGGAEENALTAGLEVRWCSLPTEAGYWRRDRFEEENESSLRCLWKLKSQPVE
jgi:hypothetical protein